MADLDQLQRDAAAERQKLAQSLDALTETVAPDNLKAHGEALWDQYAARISDAVMEKARANPTGLLLAGAGLAMLASGTGARAKSSASTPGTITSADAALDGFDERLAAADAALSAPADQSPIQPLLTGAIAMGVGALVGALLPRTQREDDLMGAPRDRAVAKAKTVLQDELDKAKAQVEAQVSTSPAPQHGVTAPHTPS